MNTEPLITRWSLPSLTVDGNDYYVEHVQGERFITLYNDDCEVGTWALEGGSGIIAPTVEAQNVLRRLAESIQEPAAVYYVCGVCHKPIEGDDIDVRHTVDDTGDDCHAACCPNADCE